MADVKLYKENNARTRHLTDKETIRLLAPVTLIFDLKKALKELHDDRKPAGDAPVLVNRYNKPWKSWRTAFKNACKRSGISDFKFHDLRHCFGSWLAKNGTDIKARMELMRHKTPAMTIRYSHLNVEYKRSAVAKLPRFSNLEIESQQISQQPEVSKVVAFTK